MPHDTKQPRYGTVNASREDHIKRLRVRVNAAYNLASLKAALQGILDLIADDGSE